MRAEHAALRIGWAKGLDDLSPQQAGGPHLGDFHVEIHPDAPKETEAGGKIVDLKTRGNRSLNVLLAISEGVGKLQRGIRPASCMWYPEIEMVLNLGKFDEQ